MSDLRQRRQAPQPSATDVARSNEQGHNIPKNRQGKLGSCYSTGTLVLFVYLAVTVAWVSLRRLGTTAPLPGTYALCSRDGAKIYTVDPTQPQVQCIVVEGSLIIDRGAMGMHITDLHNGMYDSLTSCSRHSSAVEECESKRNLDSQVC